MGERELPPGSPLASPEVTTIKKEKEGREEGRRGGREEKEILPKAVQSGVLKSDLHLPRNRGNLAVS